MSWMWINTRNCWTNTKETQENLKQKMQRWLEYCVHCKKERSWTLSERNSPNLASTRAKFLKNCWKSNEDFTCKISGQKSFKKVKKMATNTQEVNSLPLDQKNAEKRRKIIFACKLSNKRRQNVSQTERASPCNSCCEWATPEKTGFLYPRIGSKVRVSNYNRSAIFFSQLCFFSRAKQSWGPTDCF